MNQDRNRIRAFADVVSVDAWHQSFKEGNQEADLKVDVVFTEGRIGGEDDAPVQFRLKLRRATLVVVIPETEPVEAVRDSIRRENDIQSIEWSSEQTETSKLGVGAGLRGSVEPTGAKGSVTAEFSANRELSHQKTEKMSGRRAPMKTTFRVDNIEDTFNWSIECDASDFLEGRAWDANASPLMKLRDLRGDPKRGIPPNVRVAVRCRREDLVISDIRIKESPGFLQKLSGNDGKIKMKAAEAFIRTKLCEIGLEVGDLSNQFAKIVLVDIYAKIEK